MDDTRINLLNIKNTSEEQGGDSIGNDKEDNDTTCEFCNKYCINERCGFYMAVWNIVFVSLLIIGIIVGLLKLMNVI